MPSPLVPSLPFRPPVVETHYQREVLCFEAVAPCCGQLAPWTATTAGEVCHCTCDLQEAS